MRWLQRVLLIDDGRGWRERARESIVDLNDGIVSASGIAEGFAAAGASTRALVFAGATVVVTGGLASGASRYAEERTEWEMHHRMIDAERASIEADPAGELEELVAAYEARGLERGLARQVAAALTARDPVAAHADAELDLERDRARSRQCLRGVERGPVLRARRGGSSARDPVAADA
jgi:VIT1/CCC1 family predicted Fe2+/Mn2+ transporter